MHFSRVVVNTQNVNIPVLVGAVIGSLPKFLRSFRVRSNKRRHFEALFQLIRVYLISRILVFCCRHMYWVNGLKDPKIERADLDGSNRHTVIMNITSPSGLTIDFSLGLIFWVDAGNKAIECANLNGTNRRTVASELSHPFRLTQYMDYIYWSDLRLDSIYRANKTNGLDRIQIKGNIGFLFDIVVFHSSRQEGLYI